MDTDRVESFYSAWNRRDAAAIASQFAFDGTFCDPLCRVPVSHDALRDHIASVVGALTEVRFAIVRTLGSGEHLAVDWSLQAICTGKLDRELDANGVPFALAGVDLFQTSAQGVVSVRRLFERRDLAEQLGMQSIVEPLEAGTMTFGYSVRDWVSKAKPALLGMTWILARDEDEKAKIRAIARRIVSGFHAVPGFVGVVTGFAGLHGFTLTAWESEEALRAGVHGAEHVGAMTAFHQGASGGVFTSVWQPLRLNRVWIRCAHCGTANDGYRADRRCQHCATPLPEPPPYI